MAGVGGVSGLITGLDTVDLISKMLDLERRPITKLQTRMATNLDLKSAYETLEANLMALKIDARNLQRRDLFKTITAGSSNEDVVTATASGSASIGSYSLSVSQLAQNHQIASGVFSSKDELSVGTGTITISVGSDSPVEITVDSSNNTLEKVAAAINSSGADVRAVIVNIGGEDAEYKLLISGGETGESRRIVMDEDLAGGAGLQLGNVEEASNVVWSGSSVAASSGNYTGNADATFTFSVAEGGGGTVGTDTILLEYTDGNGISGTVTIPSDYTAGSNVHVYGGLEIFLGAGTVIEGDSFTVNVESSTIQAPVNAMFTLGSGAGGGTPVVLESATNTVSDLIDNVTLELLSVSSGSPVKIDVAVDIDEMVENIQTFVNRYSDVVKFFNNHFKYDEDAGAGGNLFGESFAIRLNQAVRHQVTDLVEGLDQQLTSLSVLGVKTLTDGTLTVDAASLRSTIENDPDAVVNLFSSMGRTTDADVQFLIAGSSTVPSHMVDPDGYDIEITIAATRSAYSGVSIASPSAVSPIVINSTNNTFKITLDGNETGELSIADGSYTSGAELASAIESAVNGASEVNNSRISVQYVDDGGGNGHLQFVSDQYGSSSTVEFEEVAGNSIYSTIGVSTGQLSRGTDVAGTINGEEATGAGRHLISNSDNEYTAGLQLLVTITAEQLAVQGSSQGKVVVTKGIASRLTEYLNDLTDIES